MSLAFAVAKAFPAQVTSDIFLQDVFYTLCGVALVVGIIALGLIDSGLVRHKNVLDTWIQKIVGGVIAGAAFLLVGFGIWMWQYYSMAGIHHPLSHAVSDWWLFGSHLTRFAQFFSPTINGGINAETDVFQVFLIFFVTFMAYAAALLHGAGLERLKAAPFFVMAAISGGIMIPVILYLTWGSTSPLTNHGVHDYVGLFGLYIFIGCWSLILAWRVGPRLGAFTHDLRTSGPRPSSLGSVAAGVLVLVVAVPFIALGCGFLIPGTGYLGISMTTSGFGLVLINIFAALFGGAISGALLSYWRQNSYWVLLGPLAGFVACAASFDVSKPWVMLLVAMPAPLIAYGTYTLLRRWRIDEPKVVPLVLGTGIYGALLPGIIAWGTKTGGYIGVTSGKYAFQHAQITLGWQAVGLAVTMAIAVVSGLVVIIGLEKTIGLRVREGDELTGLDAHYWSQPAKSDLEDHQWEPEVDGVAVPATT